MHDAAFTSRIPYIHPDRYIRDTWHLIAFNTRCGLSNVTPKWYSVRVRVRRAWIPQIYRVAVNYSAIHSSFPALLATKSKSRIESPIAPSMFRSGQVLFLFLPNKSLPTLLADCLISDLQHSSLSVQVFIHENASIKRRASRVAKSRGTRGADNAFRVTSPRKSLTGE